MTVSVITNASGGFGGWNKDRVHVNEPCHPWWEYDVDGSILLQYSDEWDGRQIDGYDSSAYHVQ